MTANSPKSSTLGATTDDSSPDDAGTAPGASPDQGAAPLPPAGDDVRVGPDQSDEPQAGAAEPTD
jgi:hypothetical protein